MQQRIGKYELVRELGQGATSSVYLGFDPFAQREVAIKVFHTEVLRDPARGRTFRHLLLNEAALVGRLRHPHIVQIFDAVVDDEQPYLVMEYVPGGTLEPHCAPSALLPTNQVLEIVFKCCRALEFASRQGVIHRDIKPANILLAGKTEIKISDFGAAQAEGVDRTQVSGIGSPAYMSPQQIQEYPLDQRTDIYSLGVVLYQLLTGRLPFQASNNASMIYQILNVEALPPSDLRSGLPPQLDAIVARAMNKSLEARYQGWDEFSGDLGQLVQQRSVAGRLREFAESEKFTALRDLPFFSAFSDVELWEVVRFSSWREIPAGSAVVREGEAGRDFGFVVSGELKVTKKGRLLSVLSAGDCFGEMAATATRDPTRTADIDALTATRLMVVSGTALEQASDACRMRFYRGFLDILITRLTLANCRLAGL